MARRRVDLGTLPRWAVYLLGAAIAAGLAAAIWATGHRRPAPGWYVAGVKIAAIVLIVVLTARLGRWLARGRRSRRAREPNR